jgi:hypothetical protein
MTEYGKPGWLQNAGATHTAEEMRNYYTALLAGTQGSTSLITRGGVNPVLGAELVVTQTGSPSMAVLVGSGLAVVPGSEGAKQGGYGVGNDGNVTLAIAAAHATLARIDIVVFRVRDTAYSGGVNSAVLEVVTGTPSGSPAAPALPANSLLLANVAVGAAVSSITNANITDMRIWLTGAGGVIKASSTTRPAVNTVAEGQLIYETDTDKVFVTTDAGTTWAYVGGASLAGNFEIGETRIAVKTADETIISNATFQNDDHLFMSVVPGTYILEHRWVYNTGATPDLKAQYTSPAATTMLYWTQASISTHAASGLGAASTVIYDGDGSDVSVLTCGRMVVTNSGTFQWQWAQNTLTASNTIVRGASVLLLTRIA